MALQVRQLCLILPLLANATLGQARIDAEVLYRRTHNSVVLLVPTDARGEPIAVGSGFLVGEGDAIVTNYHVIEGAAHIAVRTASGTVAVIDTLLAWDPAHDVVFLQSPITGPSLRPNSSAPDVGEDILTIGNPSGLQGSV